VGISGPVTADLTITVVHKLLINDVKPVHSLTHCERRTNVSISTLNLWQL